MAKFLVIIEKGEHNYGAYSPDVPGCASVGHTREEVQRRIQEALQFHFEGMQEEDLPLPEPQSTAVYVDIPLPTEKRDMPLLLQIKSKLNFWKKQPPKDIKAKNSGDYIVAS
jgi:predicted RNase H-like HicB family nuclease